MALTWNIEKVENFKEKIKDERLNAVKEALIWASIAIGINKITEKNAVQVYARLRAWELVHGAFIYCDNNREYITLKEIRAFIGMTTNASTLTASQFEKSLLKVDVNSINDED